MKEFIKALKKLFKQKKGFTLIELLVVIGILGVLAAMLVATIDPFEQIKKANDSKVQNTAVEFEDAMIRYYTAQTGFPWENSDNDGRACANAIWGTDWVPSAPQTTLTAIQLSALDSGSPAHGCINELIGTGELKAGFTSIVGVLDKIYISSTDLTNKKLLVCYMPLSLAGQKDINANWKVSTGTDVAPTAWTEDDSTTKFCTSEGGTHTCWWCTQ